MKLQMRPGERNNNSTFVFERPLGEINVTGTDDGDVVLIFADTGIHTSSAAQQLSITLSRPEIEMIIGAMRI